MKISVKQYNLIRKDPIRFRSTLNDMWFAYFSCQYDQIRDSSIDAQRVETSQQPFNLKPENQKVQLDLPQKGTLGSGDGEIFPGLSNYKSNGKQNDVDEIHESMKGKERKLGEQWTEVNRIRGLCHKYSDHFVEKNIQLKFSPNLPHMVILSQEKIQKSQCIIPFYP